MLDITKLYREAEDYFFRGISSKCLSIANSVTAYMTGAPVADLNPVYVTKSIKSIKKTLGQCKTFYDEANLSFVIAIPQTLCTTEMKNILSTLNYHQTGRSSSMALELDGFKAKKETIFCDVIVSPSDDQLNEWMIPLIAAFESTEKITTIYANTHESALRKKLNFYHFSLYKQEQPIASITLSLQHSIARIDDVGTLPEFQGKGYATHLITYALSEAKRLGAHYCFLESSDTGLSIYQKLGFETLFSNNIYSLRD